MVLRSPMLRFEMGRLIFYKDIERCPYTFKQPEYDKWTEEDDKRLTLIALERYLMIVDYLRKTYQYLKKQEEKEAPSICIAMPNQLHLS